MTEPRVPYLLTEYELDAIRNRDQNAHKPARTWAVQDRRDLLRELDRRAALAATGDSEGQLDVLDGARAEYNECKEVRRLLGYLWNATGKNHLRPVNDLFADDDPIIAEVERLAIFDDAARLSSEEADHD